MTQNLQTERGFRDILLEAGSQEGGPDVMEWLCEKAGLLFRQHGYAPVILPIVEPTELFVRSVGTDTDIVGKEMFYVSDGHTATLEETRRACLRPEGTASAARAYISKGFYKSNPLQRLYYTGPMFRNERPQKGRYRQFHQIGAEMFGTASPLADTEMIEMLWEYLRQVARPEVADLHLRLNSLGCPRCRPSFKASLITFLRDRRETLCDDCRRRVDTNPLRVLDCKKEQCQPVIQAAPLISDYWCDECHQHLSAVQDGLGRDVDFSPDARMVRGLDYYTRTVFEVVNGMGDVGSQNAVAGGGRYDGLVETLGGPPTPAIGFAIGVERLAYLAIDASQTVRRLYVAATSAQTRHHARELAKDIRNAIHNSQVWTDVENRSLKAQLRQAEALGCHVTTIVGDREWENGKVIVRDMKASKQEEVSKDALVPYLKQKLGLP